MLRTPSTVTFACYSAACRPPKSGGTGGSLPRGSISREAPSGKSKGNPPRTEGLGTPKFKETALTRRIREAIDAEPVLRGRMSAAEHAAASAAGSAAAKAKLEQEWRDDLSGEQKNVKMSIAAIGQQRTEIEASVRAAMKRMWENPDAEPADEIERLAKDVLEMRLGKNSAMAVSAERFVKLPNGEEVYIGLGHVLPSKKEFDSLPQDPAVTPEFEAAATRVGNVVREELWRRIDNRIASAPRIDFDAINAERERLSKLEGVHGISMKSGTLTVTAITGVKVPQSTVAALQDFQKRLREMGVRDFVPEFHEELSRYVIGQEEFSRLLQEIRPMGGTLNNIPAHKSKPDGSLSVHEQVMASSSYFPSSWIEMSNSAPSIVKYASSKNGRAKYVTYAGSRERAMMLSGKIDSSIHEHYHRMEDVIPGLTQMEQHFLNRRTAGEPLQKLDDLSPGHGYGPNEVARPDQFFNPYIGKEYGDGTAEVVTVVMQRLALGEGREIDHDLQNFVLGAVTVLLRED